MVEANAPTTVIPEGVDDIDQLTDDQFEAMCA